MAAPAGPTYVALSGETLDAAGVMTGGGSSAGAGLLQRRREVMELEARRTEAAQALELARLPVKRLPQHWAWGAKMKRSAWGGPFGKRKCWSCRSRKTTRVWSVSAANWIAAWKYWPTNCNGGSRAGAASREFLSNQSQLGQWAAEKAGQETGLLKVRERLVVIEGQKPGDPAAIDGGSALSGKHARATRAPTNDVARFTQRLDAAQRRVTDLEEQLAGLAEATENSREKQTRQEALCRELGAEVDGIKKAELVAAQEQQAQEMSGLHAVEKR